MKKILIVEGNMLSRKAMMLLIKSRIEDIQVFDVGDLNQMVVSLKIHKPDLVILDENLIGNDPSNADLPLSLGNCSLILMSVDANKMELASSLGAGFIHKGLPPDQMINLIENTFRSTGERSGSN
jgi:hypothetical protein